MAENVNQTLDALEAAKRLASTGGEYWMARDIQTILGYATWEGFAGVLDRAKEACAGVGEDVQDHFRETTKMVTIGSATQRSVVDHFLDRYACYLIAMNGEPSKPEIAAAQTYFAVQTRLQEIHDANARLLGHRVAARHRLTRAVKALNSTAKMIGVQNYAMFHDARYQGLYEMGLTEIKRKKGLGEKDELFDRAGRAELAANEFCITQTDEKLRRESLKGQKPAEAAHRQVGQQVRDAIKKIGGTMPEDLKPEASLKQLTKPPRKKRLAKPDTTDPSSGQQQPS